MKKKISFRTSLKKSINEEFEEKGNNSLSLDLQRIIDEKDQLIRKLEFRIEKLERNQEDFLKPNAAEGGITNFYKEKLQLEIKENEEAFDLFLDLSNRMYRLTEMLLETSLLDDDSSEVKGLLKLMGEANLSESGAEELEEGLSEFHNMEAIQLEVIKRFDELEIVCDVFHKNFIKTQKEYTGIEKRLKDTKKVYTDELRLLKNDVKESHSEREHLKYLLSKNEREKNELLSRIAKALDSKILKQIEKMNREEHIDYIKRLMFKISELETTKSEVIKENKKIMTTDFENYKKILIEIKEFRETNRINNTSL